MTPNNDNIRPDHYRKGKDDLYESAFRTRPFNEYRAIMEFVAERYIKRDKSNRVEDLEKAIYTLQRLKEKEEERNSVEEIDRVGGEQIMSKRQKERLIDEIMKEIDELGYFSESDVKDVIRYTIQEFEFTEQPK